MLSDFPSELLELIYTYLGTVDDFLNVWKTYNRRQQRLVEWTLFNKSDIKFYPGQVKILTALLHSQSILIKDNPDVLYQLGDIFLTKFCNPKLSMGDALQGLKLVGALRNVSLSLDLAPIKSSLMKNEQNALVCIKVMSPALGSEKHKPLIKLVKSKLNSSNERVCMAALNCLKTLIPALRKEELESFVKPVKNKLNHANWYVVRDAISCLKAMIPALEKKVVATLIHTVKKMDEDSRYDCLKTMAYALDYEDLLVLIKSVKNELNDTDPSVRKRGLKYLKAIAPAMKHDDLSALFVLVKNNLEHSQMNVWITASSCLKSMVFALEQEQLLSLVDFVRAELIDNKSSFRCAALKCLKAMVPVLDKAVLSSFVDFVRDKLTDRKPRIRYAALKCLKVMVPVLDKAILFDLVDPIKARLNDDDHFMNIQKTAMQCLKAMMPAFDKEFLSGLVDFVREKLDEEDFLGYAAATAMQCLKTLIPNLDKKDLSSFVVPVMDKLTDNDNKLSVSHEALTCLKKMIPFLEKEDSPCLLDSILKKTRKNESFNIQEEALQCLKMLVPALQKEALNRLILAVKENLASNIDYVSQVACDLLIYLLIIFDENIHKKVIVVSMDTKYRLLIQTISNWVKQIRGDREVMLAAVARNQSALAQSFACLQEDPFLLRVKKQSSEKLSEAFALLIPLKNKLSQETNGVRKQAIQTMIDKMEEAILSYFEDQNNNLEKGIKKAVKKANLVLDKQEDWKIAIDDVVNAILKFLTFGFKKERFSFFSNPNPVKEDVNTFQRSIMALCTG